MDQNTLDHLQESNEARSSHALQHPLETSFLFTPSEQASSLLSQGELALLRGDLATGLDLFESALKLDPSNSKLYYAQGLSLFEYGSSEGQSRALLLASRKFKAATQLKPDYFEAWQVWGSTLCCLGITSKEHHYFQEAHEKLLKAIELSEHQNGETLSELHWDAAVVHAHLAQHSGEALDLHQAIEGFQKAQSHQAVLPINFWKDFGSVCLKFGAQINDSRFYIKALHCFKQAVVLDSNSHETWYLLAQTFQKLYAQTHDDDQFTQAGECFAKAVQLEPHDVNLWLNWAQFLCRAGGPSSDVKRLRGCIEKCQRAFSCDSENLKVQAIWAEALALLGEATERLDLITEAQNKIDFVVETDSSDAEAWYSYGICMQACGKYFNSLDDYYQAVERFQVGVSIDRTCHAHWHAIGKTYTVIAELEGDPEILERALRFYQKAIALFPSTFYTFDYAAALAKLGEMTHEQRWLEESITQFDQVLQAQKNAVYLHPNWLFSYACALDALGDFHEEESYYLRAIEILSHVLMVDPEFQLVHHKLALALSHLGELSEESNHFFRAIHHFRLALKADEENDLILLDWALCLINIAQHTSESSDRDLYYKDAENKLSCAMRLGNLQTYYHVACLHSLLGNHESSLAFLEKAASFDALPPLNEMLQDEWLEGLRSTGDFREFLSDLERH